MDAANTRIEAGKGRWRGAWVYEPETFCPHCGTRQVWRETGPGDYYLDEQYVCIGCISTGHLWHATMIPPLARCDSLERHYLHIIEDLRAAVNPHH